MTSTSLASDVTFRKRFSRCQAALLSGCALLAVLLLGGQAPAPAVAGPLPAGGDSLSVFIPAGGNAWVTVPGTPPAEVTDSGLAGWSDPATVCRVYFRVNRGGPIRLALRVALPAGRSRIRVTCLGRSVDVDCDAGSGEWPAGEWLVERPGYLFAEVRGIERSGGTYGILEGLAASGGAAAGMNFVRTDDGNFFYWGRRGPSVHLNYELAPGLDAAWFYNEATVPPGEDILGSFFMADGFSGGYFGMQVNSASERRILFSVWSPFATDDPDSIPPDQRIALLRKGPGVHAGEFGSEGSGGQSYLVYPWRAGNTYRFLLRAEPDGSGQTAYTAYFFAPEEGAWRLVASFRRPRTTSYLKGLHSFLENFLPETGLTEREGCFGNQWVRDPRGAWHELTRARFTADNTARTGYRRDHAGGVSGARFVLRNCGFFDDLTEHGETFERSPGGIPPAIDPAALP